MTNAIVLTGGASGIGRAVLEKLLQQGRPLYNLDLRPSALPQVIDVTCDLSEPTGIEQALQKLPGAIEGLVHVAGVAPAMVSAMQVMKVNFLGMRYLNEALMPRMTPQGRIVIVASSIGRDWQENGERVNALLDQPCFETGTDWLSTHLDSWDENPYKFSKQCAAAYTYRAAGLARAKQIGVNCVNPGIVETQLSPWFRELVGPERYDHINAQVGRPGRPEDMAGLICFLLSPEGRWVNGVEISVDGGYRAGVVGGWLT